MTPSEIIVISKHFTKDQADKARLRYVNAPEHSGSAGQSGVKYEVQPTGKKVGWRWKVVVL